jgi:hypothetical protein
MSDNCDRLLYVLSARRDISWSVFKKAFDQLYILDKEGIDDPAFYRSKTLQALSNLGHTEFEFGQATARVYVLPPTLVYLPQAGLPTGVLAGCRSPALVAELEKYCSENRCRHSIADQPAAAPFTPRRIQINGDRVEDLEKLATDIGLAFTRTPPAWFLVNFSESIVKLLNGAVWKTGEELNWPKKEFDPSSLQFRAEVTNPAGFRLLRFTDPKRETNLHMLRKGQEYLTINCDWGRYAVLQELGLNVLIYDERELLFAVPTSVPLPRLLARALALCSGSAPRWLPRLNFKGASLETRGFDLFRSVPPQIAERVADCVGQLLVPRALHATL